MKYARSPFILVIVMHIFYSGLLNAAPCDNLEMLSDFNGKKIGLCKDTLLFITNVLAIDIDGSKYSYGMHDQGVENICNGLSPIAPSRCQNTYQQSDKGNGCFKYCVQKFKEWHESGRDIDKLGEFMRSIGLGGSCGVIPKVMLQPYPNTEMFVSHTSVRYGPWVKGQPVELIERQEAQIEPFEVPFFVIPGKFRNQQWDATPGDYGVAIHAQDPKRFVLFVVGDVGGNLNEGSAKLHELLRGKKLSPHMMKNAIGKVVARYGDISLNKFDDGSDLDLRIAIFRHTSSYDKRMSGEVIILQDAHNQEELIEMIARRANEELNKFGGVEAVLACTEQIKKK